MPKDASKNVDRYKVRGGHLNEYEFHQNQGQVTERQADHGWNKKPAMPVDSSSAGEGVTLTESAAKKAGTNTSKKTSTKAANKAAKKASTKSAKKASARKSAGKKASTKTSKKASKKAVKKGGKKSSKKK